MANKKPYVVRAVKDLAEHTGKVAKAGMKKVGSKTFVPPAVRAVKAGAKAVGKYMEGRKAKAGMSEFERDDRKSKQRKGK